MFAESIVRNLLKPGQITRTQWAHSADSFIAANVHTHSHSGVYARGSSIRDMRASVRKHIAR